MQYTYIMTKYFTVAGFVVGAAWVVGGYVFIKTHVKDTRRDAVWRVAGFIAMLVGFLFAFGDFIYALALGAR